MKYGYKKNLSVLIVMVLLVMVFSVPIVARAEDNTEWNYEVEPLKQNTWAPPSDNYEKDTRTIFNVNVGSQGKITFKLKDSGSSAILYTVLSDAKGTTYGKGPSAYISQGAYATTSCAVAKGNYYLRVISGKCKYSFSAVKTQTNYSRQKAQKLKAGKLSKICFTWRRNYSRWYKISNPKKKKIKFFFNGDTDFEVYDVRGRRLDVRMNGSMSKYITTDKQPKGTYFIRVMSDRSNSGNHSGNEIGKYVTVKWK